VLQADVRTLALEERYDAALMMFAVLSYQLEDADVADALGGARRHLRPGGLLIFDAWYGPAVLRQKPSPRVKTVPTPAGAIRREAWGELIPGRPLCRVKFRLARTEEGRVVAESEEDHTVRYFFPEDLARYLQGAGFDLVRLAAFPDLDREPDDTTWDALGIAQAV
jgi:SAM-dependent methyltransferase